LGSRSVNLVLGDCSLLEQLLKAAKLLLDVPVVCFGLKDSVLRDLKLLRPGPFLQYL
jgi:hypothetical protein